ncbi:hypothetical protein EYF80_062443 [Liparis tanakae]|uniref:Uncharacterized protein n=1 Tax=Liparis tanakae TaxID=230148 RepID=A0A4Z2EG19_9TELE|nr:hypothetical protein EYF80_062443 [Liparis tanakae]
MTLMAAAAFTQNTELLPHRVTSVRLTPHLSGFLDSGHTSSSRRVSSKGGRSASFTSEKLRADADGFLHTSRSPHQKNRNTAKHGGLRTSGHSPTGSTNTVSPTYESSSCAPLNNVTLGQGSQSDQAGGPRQPIGPRKRPKAANRTKVVAQGSQSDQAGGPRQPIGPR